MFALTVAALAIAAWRLPPNRKVAVQIGPAGLQNKVPKWVGILMLLFGSGAVFVTAAGWDDPIGRFLGVPGFLLLSLFAAFSRPPQRMPKIPDPPDPSFAEIERTFRESKTDRRI